MSNPQVGHEVNRVTCDTFIRIFGATAEKNIIENNPVGVKEAGKAQGLAPEKINDFLNVTNYYNRANNSSGFASLMGYLLQMSAAMDPNRDISDITLNMPTSEKHLPESEEGYGNLVVLNELAGTMMNPTEQMRVEESKQR